MLQPTKIKVIVSDAKLNSELKNVISQLIAKAENYKNSHREVDKRILLETYGLALGLSYKIEDLALRESVEKEIIKFLKEFAFEDLRLVKDIELSNLSSNRKDFKAAFDNIRLSHANANSKDLLKSLDAINAAYKKVIMDMFTYLHGMLGEPPVGSKHAIVSVGSLATGMTTPYSDVEYIILIDKYSAANRVYFTNFADLFDLLMISFGESPIYKSGTLLAEFKPYFKYIRPGARVDEHKKPQDINRLYGLINTSEELLEKMPVKIIHEPGNHLTSALLTTGYLHGDLELYNSFASLFQKVLPTHEYLTCLKKLLQEDLRASSGFTNLLHNNFLQEKHEVEVKVKDILIHTMHLARTLAVLIKSAGENIELKSKFFAIIEALKNGNYITQEQYQEWRSLVYKVFRLRLELQSKNKSAEAKISLQELHKQFNIPTFIKQLQEINNLVQGHLDKRKSIQHTVRVADVTKKHLGITGQQYQRPLSNPNYVQRQTLWNKMTEHFKTPEQQILTLAAHGMGGMGKTELAGYYYLNPPRPYALRAWFRAGSRDEVYQQYVDLIKRVEGIEYPKEIPIEKQAEMVKEWLEKQKDCLLVYDNVETARDLDGLLPQQGKHHILITSRNEVDWPISQRLDVDVMTENEAIDLIVKITAINKEKNFEQLKTLANTLGHLPLALIQAGAYIRESPDGIKQYLNIYNDTKYNNQAELLKYKSESLDATKHEPVWITFDINFKALEKTSPLALAALKQSSWLANSDIPNLLLANMIPVEDESRDRRLLWNDVSRQIRRYSLMRFDTEKNLASMHPLLQGILRSKQTEEEQIATFKYTCETLDEMVEVDEKLDLNYRGFLDHAERLNQHGEHIAKLAVKYNDKNAELLLTKPNSLYMIYFNSGLPRKRLACLTETKKIYEKHYGPKDRMTIAILVELGGAFEQLGMLTEAEKYLNEVLEMLGSDFGKGDYETAGAALGHLGAVFLKRGELNKAKKYLEDALNILEPRFVDKKRYKIAKTLVNLGSVLRQLGKFDDATKHLEEALKIQVQHYGPSHYETSATLVNLGILFKKLGKLDAAEKLLEQALEIDKIYSGPKSYETANTMANLGAVFLKRGELNKAKKYLEDALEIQQARSGRKGFELLATLRNLGAVFRRLGKSDAAEECLKWVLEIDKEHVNSENLEKVNNAHLEQYDIPPELIQSDYVSNTIPNWLLSFTPALRFTKVNVAAGALGLVTLGYIRHKNIFV